MEKAINNPLCDGCLHQCTVLNQYCNLVDQPLSDPKCPLYDINNERETFETMYPYLFHRAEGFYIVELRHDRDALACISLNPGTIRVERVLENGKSTRLVWGVLH